MHRFVILEAAHKVAGDILAHRIGAEALRHVADAARAITNARHVALGVARPDGKSLIAFVTVGLSAEEEAAGEYRPQCAGILSHLLTCEQPLRIDDPSQHEVLAGVALDQTRMDSFLGIPIRRGEIPLGSLYLAEKRDAPAFTAVDEAAVQALAEYAAVAIYHLQLQERQRILVAGLISAQEEERRAIAYDLHDGLTQFVMAAHAHLEAFQSAQESSLADDAQSELTQGLGYLKEAVVESRRLVNGLRTLALDDLGLAGALEQLLHDEKVRGGWVSEASILIQNVGKRCFGKSLEMAAYRVVQEALTNARKHANAGHVQVLLVVESSPGWGSGEQLTLEVRDSGNGFVPEEHEHLDGHFGLRSMAERVRLLDGRFDIISAPGKGTSVRATFPIEHPIDEAEIHVAAK